MKVLIRLYRLAVVIMIAWLMKDPVSEQRAELEVEKYFSEAANYSPKTHEVFNAEGKLLGYLLTTLPETSHLKGYSGPADVVIVLDTTGQVVDLELLHSPDTEDHLDSVIEDEVFWRSHFGLSLGAPGSPKVDAVSGSTLTSLAISRSIIERLGGETESRLFPTDILLAEFAALVPEAKKLEDHPEWAGVKRLYDAQENVIAHALRTAPAFEYLKGFQGPTDVLIVLDDQAQKVIGLSFRKSYDNEDYYERILDESDYLQLYNGRTILEIIGSEDAEGVSGATDTSWAIAEGVKRRLAQFESSRTPKIWSFPVRNLALIALTIGALVFSFTKLRGNPLARVIWQIAVVVILGFLLGDLLSQALFVGWAKHGLPLTNSWGLVALAGAALLIPWAFGNQLYCHQMCPHGFLQQWLGRLTSKRVMIHPKIQKMLSYLPPTLLVLIALCAILSAGFNYADFEAFDAWLWRSAGIATIVICVLGLIASIFIPMAYCKFGCPTGALFKFLRYTSAGNRFSIRDSIAGVLLVFASYFS